MIEDSRIKLTFDGVVDRSSSFENRYSIEDDQLNSPKDFGFNDKKEKFKSNMKIKSGGGFVNSMKKSGEKFMNSVKNVFSSKKKTEETEDIIEETLDVKKYLVELNEFKGAIGHVVLNYSSGGKLFLSAGH